MPDDGIFDAMALVDNAETDFFSIAFHWLGDGVPGSQTFEIYDENFTLIEQGITTTPVPEPTTLLLLGFGLLSFASLISKKERILK